MQSGGIGCLMETPHARFASRLCAVLADTTVAVRLAEEKL